MKFHLNLVIAWLWLLLGFVAGMVLGMFFHGENWLGGYGSFKRRMYRLRHIFLFWFGGGHLLLFRIWRRQSPVLFDGTNFLPGRSVRRRRVVGFHCRRDLDAGLLRGDGAF